VCTKDGQAFDVCVGTDQRVVYGLYEGRVWSYKPRWGFVFVWKLMQL